MGLNDKKPYIENKTRKVEFPNLINQEDVLIQKKVFDYFLNLVSVGKCNVYIGDEIIALKNEEHLNRKFKGFYLRLKKISDKKGTRVEIIDFDIISNYNPNLSRVFNFKNILDVEYNILYQNKKCDIEGYGKKIKLSEIEELVNIIFFNKFLCTNYFSEDISIKDDGIKKAIFIARGKLNDWFRKGNKSNVWIAINKGVDLVIKSNLENGYFIKAMNQFNLKHSLKEYFMRGDYSMADILIGIKGSLRNKIFSKEDSKIDNDKEYFFAVGQLANYFLRKSNESSKTLDFINPIINTKNNKLIKKNFERLFEKYNYSIEDINIRFKNLYSMIIGYEIEGDINKDLIIAGYLSNNIIYEKKEN